MNYLDNDYFQSQFLKDFHSLGQDSYNKYSQIVQNYTAYVVPFERKRMAENQKIIMQNSTLEKDKLELMEKIEKLRSENERHESMLESQRIKMNDLQRTVEQLERIKQNHENQIVNLRFQYGELEDAMTRNASAMKQMEQDKENVWEKYQLKNNDYNILLANYMKDKNLMAEKLNHMNQLENALMEKDKEIKAERFYLQKQWEEFQDAKSKMKTPQPKQQRQSKTFGIKATTSLKEQFVKEEEDNKNKKNKDLTSEILRNPLKKIYKHHGSEIYSLSFNYNGNLLATCGGDKMIKIYDVFNSKNGATIASNSAQNIYISAMLNYGGERLLTGSTDKNVTIFHTDSGKSLHSFLGHGDKVNAVTWTSAKEKCVSGSEDKQIKIWDIEKTSNLLSVNCGKAVRALASNNVQAVVYSGHSDGSVRVYSINQGNAPISQIKGVIDESINSICILSNRNQVLVSSRDSSIHLLDLKMNKSIEKYEHPEFYNSAVQADITPSQGLVLGGNCDGNIYYWDRFKKHMIKKVSGHDGQISSLKYHFMSGLLVSADKEGNLILWQ